jgi:hypothetical protein
MAGLARKNEAVDTIQLHAHAMDNLKFIRDTMSRSSSFTAVPGWGMVAMGVVAIVGSYVASIRLNPDWWIFVWTSVGGLAWATGTVAILAKARRSGEGILAGPGRRFVLGFSPAILVGVVLTQALYFSGGSEFIPGMWLMLYGAAVISGGVFSIPLVPLMGGLFMVLGGLVLLLPIPKTPFAGTVLPIDLIMALGFGGLHIAFGVRIATRHGG